MKCTYGTLNDYEMQHNAGVGLFTKPSIQLFEKSCATSTQVIRPYAPSNTAVTLVVIPPLAVKSPVTSIDLGSSTATRSSRIRLTKCS